MKATVWFEARGQSMRARGFNWHEAKVLIGLYALPKWAQRAFARGHLNATRGVPASSLTGQLQRAVEASDEGHDPLCMTVLRGKECTCGVTGAHGETFSRPDADDGNPAP